MNVENSDGGDTCSEDGQFHNVREESSSDENDMDEVVSPAANSERRDVSENIHPTASVAGGNGSAHDRDCFGWKFDATLPTASVVPFPSGKCWQCRPT